MLEPAEERKIPWWAWVFLVFSVLLFLGFFLTFAIGVTKGGVDGYVGPRTFIGYSIPADPY